MADRKLSELTELAAAPAVDDEVYIRDVSEAAADESKRITTTNLLASLPATTLAGKLTGGAQEIEGSAFDINGGTMASVTLDGTLTLGSQAFDAGAGSAQINTTGNNQGMIIRASHASHGVGMYLYQDHTTPDLNSIIGGFSIFAYDHAGAPAQLQYGIWRFIHSNIGDGTEEAKMEVYMMAAGTINNLALTLSGAGALGIDVNSGVTYADNAHPVSVFDRYDDALLLKQGIGQRGLDKLVDVGVFSKKDTGSGYMMNVQAFSYLLAGGIYQNRQRIDDLMDALVQEFPQVAQRLAERNLLALPGGNCESN